ncbi:MAG: DUF72 domain-containing protein [Myxococcota bacterium]
MDALVGTSGYAYDFWKGGFYPEDMKSDGMLEYYAERLPTVEINNTFYRIPKRDVVQRWADVTPDSFRFVIKASRRITHLGRLGDVKDSLDYLLAQLVPLGEKCGPVLFQCPPAMRKDVAKLDRFLGWVPEHVRPAMEFRHASWADEAVYDVLRAHDAAWVITDDDSEDPPIVATAPWGFLRLRAGEYDEAARQRWAQHITTAWKRAFVFFKHENRATELAFELRDTIAALPTETPA